MTVENLQAELSNVLEEKAQQETTSQPPASPPAPAPVNNQAPPIRPEEIDEQENEKLRRIVSEMMKIQARERIEAMAAERSKDPFLLAEDLIEQTDLPLELKENGKKEIQRALQKKPNATIDDARYLAEYYTETRKEALEARRQAEIEYKDRRELNMFRRYGQEYQRILEGMYNSLEEKGLTRSVAKIVLDSTPHDVFDEQVEKYYREEYLGKAVMLNGKNNPNNPLYAQQQEAIQELIDDFYGKK